MSDVSKMILQQLKGLDEGAALKFLEKVREEAQDAHLAAQVAEKTALTNTRAFTIDDLTAKLDKMHEQGPTNYDAAEHKRVSSVLAEKLTQAQAETQRQEALDAIPEQITKLDMLVVDLELLMKDPEKNIAEISRIQREVSALRFGDPRARYRT